MWYVRDARALVGPPLPAVTRVAVYDGAIVPQTAGVRWRLRGTTSHQRYVERAEGDTLRARQARIGRREATRAALIPITKSPEWWELAQDERRAIFEERSQHIASTLKYLPAIARRLHHGRDLGEMFDFLTWFEFAPENEDLFDEMLAMLRKTEEWKYVEREIDIRLER